MLEKNLKNGETNITAKRKMKWKNFHLHFSYIWQYQLSPSGFFCVDISFGFPVYRYLVNSFKMQIYSSLIL